jgi:GDP/UDP-N,N'-diacetylbacillosamine 2-epimerase (hydrolysing)
MNVKRICVVTSTRAEYGLLKHLIKEIKTSQDLDLHLVVSGTHLSPFHGNTVEEIIDDGFNIDAKLDLELIDDSSQGISRSASIALNGFVKIFQSIKPDIILLLGDRYEILSAAIASMFAKIPIVHLYGGEITQGAIDEGIRHAITKLSHFHFVANDVYRNRVIQLGESPENVFNVGGLGVDAMTKIVLMSKAELEIELNFLFKKKNLLITFHPETISAQSSSDQLEELLSALSELTNTKLIFTMPNADPDSRAIYQTLNTFVATHPDAVLFNSLGQLKYFSCMALVDCVVGNSSSGIAETPSFKIPTINIGDRQKGRMKARSIIDCETKKNHITAAIQKAYSSEFQKKLNATINPYGNGGAVNQIIDMLRKINLENALKKSFYDINIKS